MEIDGKQVVLAILDSGIAVSVYQIINYIEFFIQGLYLFMLRGGIVKCVTSTYTTAKVSC